MVYNHIFIQNFWKLTFPFSRYRILSTTHQIMFCTAKEFVLKNTQYLTKKDHALVLDEVQCPYSKGFAGGDRE